MVSGSCDQPEMKTGLSACGSGQCRGFVFSSKCTCHLQEMADQQLKQMLLAYMLLIIKERALLQDDLDNACEDFLYKEFNHPIDYDIAAALPRLKRWGLVRTNQQVIASQ